MSETKHYDIEIHHVKRDAWQVIGMDDKFDNNNRNPKLYYSWSKYKKANAYEILAPYQTEGMELGIFYNDEPGHYHYLIGGVVGEVDEVPEGFKLVKFPASEFLIVTHEWSKNKVDAKKQIGRIVAYAHSDELKFPDGYEKCTEHLAFVEGYNFNTFGSKRHRFEVWLAMKKAE